MKRLIATTAFLILAANVGVHADEGDTYPDLASIPAPLAQQVNIYNGGYEEMYVSNMLQVIRNAAADKMSLTKGDIEKAQERERRATGQNSVNEILRFDVNFDEKVTADEILQTLKSERGNNRIDDKTREEEVRNLMKRFDLDGDGTITYAEAQSATDAQNKRILRNHHRGQSQLEALLALDPDKDGVLTVTELESLARKAFRTVDTDHDGIISPSEAQAFQAALRPEAAFPEGCQAPPPSDSDKIIFVSVGQAGAISDVGFLREGFNNGLVRAERQVTGAPQLDIQPGKGKLYIIAQSAQQAIWNVTGDTQRISRLVLAGPGSNYGQDEPTLQIGAAGIDRGVVSFLKSEEYPNCALQVPFSEGASMEAGDTIKSAVGKLLGHPADSIMTELYGSRISIDADGIAAPASPAPSDDVSGLDPETWKEVRLLLPGGLARLKGKTIISDSSTEPYPVLPGWAGIAQLVHDGVLVPEARADHATRIVVDSEGGPPESIVGTGNSVVNATNGVVNIVEEKQYRIVKNLVEFPPGLGGDRSLRFVLAKGVTKPDVQMPVCVISEETGKPLENNWLCRGRSKVLVIHGGVIY